MKCPDCGKTLWFVRELCPFCKVAIAAPQRPRSVTVVSWVFLAFGALALLMSMLPKAQGIKERSAEFKSQHPIMYALIFLGPILAVVSGAGMLRGFNWARWAVLLYFGNNVISNVIVNATHGVLKSLLPGLLFGLAVFYLFRPQANAFFLGVGTIKSKTPPDETHAP